MRRWRQLGAVTAAASCVVAGLTVAMVPAASATASATDWGSCLAGSPDRQAVFARAAAVSGVPEQVLLGVSYMESRWDDHHGEMSTSGGFGPMHLTVRDAGAPDGRGAVAKADTATAPAQLGTLLDAARTTGWSAQRLREDPVANVCGGAAVLASYQPRTGSAAPRAWSVAVARYAQATDEQAALTFARQVFAVIRSGEQRTTVDGQHVTLAATPGATVDTAAVESMGLAPDDNVVDCPPTLGCQSVPAPYEWYAPDKGPGWYGNHDLADRPHDMKIDYIVIHDTEGYWDHDLQLVQDPTYLAWNYTIRSSDGHVAEHLNNKNIGWHAGNWYVNMHSIGVEHEGFAATGATWYTERMYESSAALVGYLAHEYGVPLDRAHIIGHDQVPGVTPAYVAGMHWDPGPYWDWEHYMTLLGAPVGADATVGGDVVTVTPDFAQNPEKVKGCTNDGTCERQGTNFVYLHTAPDEDSPLVSDIGLHPDGSPSTTEVSDIGARVAAGQKLVVARREGDWVGVWYLGELGWLRNRNAAKEPVLTPSSGTVVVPAGDTSAPVYGRAYPEKSAYSGTAVPPQSVVPLQYTIKPGQAYVLADDNLQTDYYYAKTYDCAYVADDCTQIVGKDRYYEIWFGHRIAYVRAADVRLSQG